MIKNYFDGVSDEDRRDEVTKLQANNPSTGDEWLRWGAPESAARDNSAELQAVARAHSRRGVRGWVTALAFFATLACIVAMTYTPVVYVILQWHRTVGMP